MPFDVAFGLDRRTRRAWCIITQEQSGSGRTFDFDTMEFVDPV